MAGTTFSTKTSSTNLVNLQSTVNTCTRPYSTFMATRRTAPDGEPKRQHSQARRTDTYARLLRQAYECATARVLHLVTGSGRLAGSEYKIFLHTPFKAQYVHGEISTSFQAWTLSLGASERSLRVDLGRLDSSLSWRALRYVQTRIIGQEKNNHRVISIMAPLSDRDTWLRELGS